MKRDLEHIVLQALIDSINPDSTSQEVVTNTVEKIRKLYEPTLKSLEESNKLVTNLQLEAQELKVKIDFLLQELSLKEDLKEISSDIKALDGKYSGKWVETLTLTIAGGIVVGLLIFLLK